MAFITVGDVQLGLTGRTKNNDLGEAGLSGQVAPSRWPTRGFPYVSSWSADYYLLDETVT